MTKTRMIEALAEAKRDVSYLQREIKRSGSLESRTHRELFVLLAASARVRSAMFEMGTEFGRLDRLEQRRQT